MTIAMTNGGKITKMTAKESGLDQDIVLYRELMKRSEELESEIPPRKSKVGWSAAASVHRYWDSNGGLEESRIQEEASGAGEASETEAVQEADKEELPKRRYPLRNTRSKTRSTQRSNAIKPEQTNRIRTRPSSQINVPKRPQYHTNKTQPTAINRHDRNSQNQKNHIKPMTINSIKINNHNHRDYKHEQNVQLDHTYSTLISMIKSNISQDHIDIPLVNRFIPKNLTYEIERFQFKHDESSPVLQATNQLTQNGFNSYDIDSFFDFLNGIDTNQHPPDKLKLEIPLV